MENDKMNLAEKEELLQRCITAEQRLKSLESEQDKFPYYKKEVQKLETENVLLSGRIEKFNNEINIKNRQIDELFKKWENSDINHLYKEREELIKTISAREEKIQKLESQLQNLFVDIEEKGRKIIDLTMDLDKKSSSFLLLQKENEHFKKEIGELKSGIKEMMPEEIAQFQQSVMEREIARFKNRLQELQKSYENEQERLQQEISQLESLYFKRGMEIKDLNQKVSAIQEERRIEVEESKKIIAELRKELENKNVQIGEFNQQLSVLDSKVVSQNSKIEELKSAISQKESETANLLQKLKFQSAKLASLSSLLERSQIQGTEYLSQITNLREELTVELDKKAVSQEVGVGGKPQQKKFESQAERGSEKSPKEAETVSVEPQIALKGESASPPVLKDESVSPPILKDVSAREAVLEAVSHPVGEDDKKAATSDTGIVSVLAEVSEVANPSVVEKRELKVLLAGDHPESMELLSQSLVRKNYKVQIAEDGNQVIEFVHKEIPNLIIMNVAIGGVDSYSVCKELMQDSRTERIPIILIASNPAMTEIFQTSPMSAVKTFLYKPFSIREFMSVIDNIFS